MAGTSKTAQLSAGLESKPAYEKEDTCMSYEEEDTCNCLQGSSRSLHMYVYIHVQMCVCVHMYVDMHVQMCVCVHMYAYIHVQMCVCLCKCLHTCTNVCCVLCVCACVCARACLASRSPRAARVSSMCSRTQRRREH